MATAIIRGDARRLPLPDGCVDLVVTSPPYFGLRSYTDGGEHYGGQIGSEATPQEWVAAMVECTREMVRVLKPEGSIFINLGDKYDSGTTTGRVNPGTVKDGQGQGWHQGTPRISLGRPKSLLGLPWRYALACTDQLGPPSAATPSASTAAPTTAVSPGGASTTQASAPKPCRSPSPRPSPTGN